MRKSLLDLDDQRSPWGDSGHDDVTQVALALWMTHWIVAFPEALDTGSRCRSTHFTSLQPKRSDGKPLDHNRKTALLSGLHRDPAQGQRSRSNGAAIFMFPDYPLSVARARSAFNEIRKLLRGRDNVCYSILHPARLRITHNGTEKLFQDADRGYGIFSEVDSSITQAEVTEVVHVSSCSGKAPGVDEIRPEYLKSLDVVGLSWLTHLCNIAWRLGTVPLEWQTGVVVPLFKKGDRRVCSNYRGITLLSLPGSGKVSRQGCLRVYGSLPNQSTCALWIWRRHLTVSLVVFCVGVLLEYGVRGPLVRAVRSLYDRSRKISRRSQGPEGVRFGNHRISSLLFADDVVLMASSGQDLQHVLERFAAECEAAGMRISTSKS
ncbi:hypothetical protein L3Q82_014672 [Scortum barcoo]|uniref:Uncharacterized protein n=1 Tax=Scortum barcoo TaxID=214431 RepID=A0ACB8VRT8_9TELE|nr:hypothetical protein L3Q82_014672 [Scortum barcoo]